MKYTGYNSVKSWGIVLACSFVYCMCFFPLRVSSMLFVDFISRYDTDRQNAAYFIVINGVLTSIFSPLVGYLGAVFELRNIITVGCLLTSLGVGICYFAEDILGVTLSLGFLYGTGYIMQNNLLPQILKQHFTENIATANGAMTTGSCVESFILIPVFKILLDMYGVSGALLISSGIMLQAVPVAMLLREPKYEQSSFAITDNKSIADEEVEGSRIINNFPKREIISITKPIVNDENYIVERNYTISNDLMEKEDCNTVQSMLKCNAKSIEGDILLIKTIPFQLSSTSTKKVIVIEQNNENNSIKKIKHDSSPAIEKRNKFTTALNTLLIFKNPTFLGIIFCQSVFMYVVIFNYTILVDISRDKGIPQSQEYIFLMVFPLVQIVGLTCFGWVTDKGYLTAANFLAIANLCLGLTCCGFVFLNSFLTMMIAVTSFALCIAVIAASSPSLIYEFVDETKQTMAISSRHLLYAPLCFTIAPMIRYFRGTLGSYNGILYFFTALCVGCSAILMFLPRIARCTSINK